jgi:site-specific recombinase XerD
MVDDLFSRSKRDWLADPRAAFDAWLAHQGFKSSSAQTYRAQWGNFLDWLAERRIELDKTNKRTVGRFVATLSIRRPQRQRYLRIIERVFDEMRQSEAAATNPARPVAQRGDAAWRKAPDNEPTGFLLPAERATLIAQLFSPMTPLLSATAQSKESRDRALVAVFLGAGVKVSEAKSLTVSCVNGSDERILIEAANPHLSRRSRLMPFARVVLQRWIEVRRTAGIAGELLFPGAPDGRPMHKATMLRAVDAQIDAAGIGQARKARASPQTLRNSFAAELFESGAPPERIAEWMGFAQLLSANRLQTAWKNWRESDSEVSDQDTLRYDP